MKSKTQYVFASLCWNWNPWLSISQFNWKFWSGGFPCFEKYIPALLFKGTCISEGWGYIYLWISVVTLNIPTNLCTWPSFSSLSYWSSSGCPLVRLVRVTVHLWKEVRKHTLHWFWHFRKFNLRHHRIDLKENQPKIFSDLSAIKSNVLGPYLL